MASPATSIIWFALLTLCLSVNLDCAVEARESMYFSRFNGNEKSPNGGESGVKGYTDNDGADGVRDVNNGFGSEPGDGVGGAVGYGSGGGTAYEEPNNAYFPGSDGAYGTESVRQEDTGAYSHREDSTNTMPSFENAENQENQDGRFGNGYSSHSTPYRGAGSGSNNGYKADSGYGRSFARNSYNPSGSREYDRNTYNSNMGGGGGYEHTGSGYGEYVGGGN